jgi:hypothetical protein
MQVVEGSVIGMEQLSAESPGQSARFRRVSCQRNDAIRHGNQVSADLDMRLELVRVLVSVTSEETLQCFDEEPDNGLYLVALDNSRDLSAPR